MNVKVWDVASCQLPADLEIGPLPFFAAGFGSVIFSRPSIILISTTTSTAHATAPNRIHTPNPRFIKPHPRGTSKRLFHALTISTSEEQSAPPATLSATRSSTTIQDAVGLDGGSLTIVPKPA
jgi:hypothetical protein